MADDVGENEGGWTPVSDRAVAVGTCLAIVAPRVKWTPPMVGQFIRMLQKRGYELTEIKKSVAVPSLGCLE